MGLTPSLFTSEAVDSGDETLLGPIAWNRVTSLLNSLLDGADADGSILFRDSADVTDGASWLAPGAAGTVLAGTGAAPAFTDTPSLTSLTLTNLINPAAGITHLQGIAKAGDATRKNTRLRWDATDDPASAGLIFTMNLASYANFGSEDNNVFEMGHNVQVGGGLLNASYSGARDAWESYYEPSTPGVGQHERHISIIPLDVPTKGEIRLITMAGSANVNRDSVHPFTVFQSENWQFTYPSTAGNAYGDSFRITIDGTHFGVNFSLNNGYSYLSRRVSQGVNYPLLFQQDRTQSYDMRAFWWDTADNAMHLFWDTNATFSILHAGIGGIQTRFFVDGKNSANLHGILIFRDEQGSGTKESFVAQDGSALYLGAPQSALANYNDATIAAAAHLTLTSALATFTGGLKHGSTTLLQTSVALTNGAAAQTGTLTNAPAAGNPTKWIPINDNGTTRYIPSW